MSLVMRQLRKAPTERGPAIFIAGDGGIGKSSFLRACATEASDFANVLALSRGSRTEAVRARIGSIGKRRPTLVVLDDFDRVLPEEPGDRRRANRRGKAIAALGRRGAPAPKPDALAGRGLR